MYNVTLEQIHVFLTIADTQSLTRAAELLYTSQPAISRTLSQFEKSIGVRVFSRSNSGVRLTREGEFLREKLSRICAQLDELFRDAANNSLFTDRNLRLTLPISYDHVDDYKLIRQIIQAYQEKYPEVTTYESMCEFHEIRNQLENDLTDIIVAPEFVVSDMPYCKKRAIGQYKMYIAVSENHPLAQLDKIEPKQLSGETIYLVPHHGTKEAEQHARGIYLQMGFTPKSIKFALNYQTLLHYINSGKGVSICAKFNTVSAEKIKYYEVEQAQTAVIVGWREESLTKEAEDFLALVPEWRK